MLEKKLTKPVTKERAESIAHRVTVSDVVRELEKFAPSAYQEDYDNSGLMVGRADMEVTGVLICVDVTEAVIEEAVAEGCNLIVSHHPLIFKALKRITGKGYVDGCVMRAIENSIAIFAGHTSVDSVQGGVSYRLAQKLGLQDVRVLQPKEDSYSKMTLYIKQRYVEVLMGALERINTEYRAACHMHHEKHVEDPYAIITTPEDAEWSGCYSELPENQLDKIEVIFPTHLLGLYEDVMDNFGGVEQLHYDVVAVKNRNYQVGFGVVGMLPGQMDTEAFFQMVKERCGASAIRYSTQGPQVIRKVALCGGSGSDFIGDAKRCGADIYLTGELGYHYYYEANRGFMIADMGHYESEQFTKEIFYEQLIEKFSNFAIRISKASINPTKVI